MSVWHSVWLTFALFFRLTQGDGFLRVSEVVQTSLDLSHYTNHATSSVGHWIISPHLLFLCNCSITGWTFIASSSTPVEDDDDGVPSPQGLELQTWQWLSNAMLTQTSTVKLSTSNINHSETNQMGMTLVEINLNEPIRVKEGDVLGIFQPKTNGTDLVLQFQKGLGPPIYEHITNLPSVKYLLRGSQVYYDYPLLAPKHDCPNECQSGFSSSRGVRQFFNTNTNTQLINHRGNSRVFPALNFTCDTSILAIKLGAKPVTGNSWPLVELWRESNDVIQRKGTISLTNSTHLTSPGVYEYVLPRPLPINANDLVSLYEMKGSQLEVFSEEDSGMFPLSVYVLGPGGGRGQVFSDNDRPLLHIVTVDKGCTTGFSSLSNLKRKSLQLALVTDYNTLTIVPSIKFPKSGNISKFVFSGAFISGGKNRRQLYPEIQIWRRNFSNNFESLGDTYVKIFSVGNETKPSFSGMLNVFEYVFEDLVAVEEGDVLGYYQPPSLPAPFVLMRIFAVDDGETKSYSLFGQNSDEVIFDENKLGTSSTRSPLISYKYDILSETEDDPTSEREANNSGSGSGDGGGGNYLLIIIGAAVGGVVIGLVLVVAVCVMVCMAVRMRRKKKKKKKKKKEKKGRSATVHNNNIPNPTYTDGRSTLGPTYAEPSDLRPPPTSPPPSPYSQLFFSGPCSPYELPTPSRLGTVVSAFKPDHLYASLSSSGHRAEFTANLKAVVGTASVSDGGETIRLSDLSSRSGGNSGDGGSDGVKIYEECVYHEPELVQKQKKVQWGMYVPTEEQRASVYYSSPTQGSDSDLYAELLKQVPPEQVYDDQVSNVSVSSNSGGTGSGLAFFQEEPTYWAPAEDTQGLYKQLSSKKYRELSRKQISLAQHLGSGQFGRVVQGVWSSPKGPIDVAVKTLKQGSTETDKIRFLQEAAINGQFKHPNIVKLIGVVTIDHPVMIVLELMSNGDLKNNLLQLRLKSVKAETLLKYCRDVAYGMTYLAGKSFVHRDLAARNILVSHNLTCKISDFGMSRSLVDEETYYMSKGGKIPIKWTAPEAIHYKKYSTASDVWSYGMVMYEIWSLGKKPFSEFTNAQTVGLLERSFCLPPPPGTPHEIYHLMVQCWHPDHSQRPSFPDITRHLNLPVSQLLHWTTEETVGLGPQAIMIGAPLKTAHKLHTTLQNTYRIRP